jgi:hypothetical protein
MMDEVEDRILVEYGTMARAKTLETSFPEKPLIEHYLSCDTDQFLDFLEFMFQARDHCCREVGVETINGILRDGSIAYELSPFVIRETDEVTCVPGFPFPAKVVEYEFPQVIVKDSEFAHAEAVVPAIQLLTDSKYKNASAEYLKAHSQYRKGDNVGCLNECLKAFESTMKVICHAKKWPHKQTDTASQLVKVCLDKGLLPTYNQQQLTSLRTLLESAVPTPRNKQAGHGAGVQANMVPDYLAKYLLHVTAVTIALLVEAARK